MLLLPTALLIFQSWAIAIPIQGLADNTQGLYFAGSSDEPSYSPGNSRLDGASSATAFPDYTSYGPNINFNVENSQDPSPQLLAMLPGAGTDSSALNEYRSSLIAQNALTNAAQFYCTTANMFCCRNQIEPTWNPEENSCGFGLWLPPRIYQPQSSSDMRI